MITFKNQSLAQILMNKKTWITHFTIVALISIIGLVFVGQQTYSGAPPLVDFISGHESYESKSIISQKSIKRGDEIFHLRDSHQPNEIK